MPGSGVATSADVWINNSSPPELELLLDELLLEELLLDELLLDELLLAGAAGTNAGLFGKLASGNRLFAATISAAIAPSCVKKVLKYNEPSATLLLEYPCQVRNSPTLDGIQKSVTGPKVGPLCDPLDVVSVFHGPTPNNPPSSVKSLKGLPPSDGLSPKISHPHPCPGTHELSPFSSASVNV